MGWFGLKKGYEMAEGQEEEETPVISSIIAPPVISVSKIHVNSGGGGRITSSIQRPVTVQSLLSAGQTQQHTLQMTGGEGSGMGVEGKGVEREGWNFHPKVVYKKRLIPASIFTYCIIAPHVCTHTRYSYRVMPELRIPP